MDDTLLISDFDLALALFKLHIDHLLRDGAIKLFRIDIYLYCGLFVTPAKLVDHLHSLNRDKALLLQQLSSSSTTTELVRRDWLDEHRVSTIDLAVWWSCNKAFWRVRIIVLKMKKRCLEHLLMMIWFLTELVPFRWMESKRAFSASGFGFSESQQRKKSSVFCSYCCSTIWSRGW